MPPIEADILDSALYRFRMYKSLGEGALEQASHEDLAWQPHPEMNSINVIVKHLHGNMISRWTQFLTTDTEKPDRDRDAEFLEDETFHRRVLDERWEAGWARLFETLEGLGHEDLHGEIILRGKPLTVIDAINRQLGHVAYHVGQMVTLARQRRGDHWKTLSILRGQSKNYVPKGRD